MGESSGRRRQAGSSKVTEVVVLALVGTVLATVLVLVNLAATRDDVGWLLHAGPTNSAAPLLARDFPEEPVTDYGSHDGAYFYAIATDPWHPSAVTPYLDRPAYRLQRPLFSVVSWALHPTGGGPGLAWTMFAVGVAAMVIGAISTGLLSTSLGGPPWLALVFPLLPGSLLSLRITVADTLAAALMILAMLLMLRSRSVGAVLVGIAAVLTKEPVLLSFIGIALWRRDRRGAVYAAVPAAVGVAWALFLKATVPAGEGSFIDFRPPFVGWVETVQAWADDPSPLAILSVVGALVLAAVALIRSRPSHPLWWAVALNGAFLVLLNNTTLALERNAPRTALPLLVVSLVCVATPHAAGLAAPPRPASLAATG